MKLAYLVFLLQLAIIWHSEPSEISFKMYLIVFLEWCLTQYADKPSWHGYATESGVYTKPIFRQPYGRIRVIHQSCRKLQLTPPSSLYQMTAHLNHAGARGCLSHRWALQASAVAYTAVSSLLFIRYKGEGPRPPKTKTTRTMRRINLPSVTQLYTHGSIKLENSYILQAKLFGWGTVLLNSLDWLQAKGKNVHTNTEKNSRCISSDEKTTLCTHF